MPNTINVVDIGHVPQARGAWDGSRYYKDNIVQYQGSAYIASPPDYDPVTNPEAYITTVPWTTDPHTLNPGWSVFSSGNNTFTTGERVDEIGVDDTPKSGSDNLIKSRGVHNELALGAVYDVSAKNPTAGPNNDGKWESLPALLSDANLNTLIPTAVRKGGMSIKFVQTSDNKYVQYRLMSDEFSVTPSDWQGVDDEPTAGSKNLVESDGVKNLTNRNLRGFMMSNSLYKSLLLDNAIDVTPSEFSNGEVNAKGEIVTNSSFRNADISLDDGYVYNITMWNGGSSSWYGITVFDANGLVLFNQNKGLSGHFVFPRTATKLRVCTYYTETSNLSITKQEVKETSGLLELIANNKTNIENIDSKFSKSVYYEEAKNLIVPTTGFELVGTTSNGYYDDNGNFHSDANYICREVTIKRGCIYTISANPYDSKPSFVGFDASNNVLFVIKEQTKKTLSLNDNVVKIAACSYVNWGAVILEKFSYTNLELAIDKKIKKKTGNNVFDISKAVSGYNLLNGVYAAIPNSNYTSYKIYEIDNIEENTKICVTLPNYLNCAYSAINKYGTLIANCVSISSNTAIDITGVYKMLLMVYASDLTEVMVNFGETPLPYEPYKEYYDIVAVESNHAKVADALSNIGTISPLVSNVGTQKKTATAASLSNANLILTSYPLYLKKDNTTLVDAKVTAFNEMVVGIGTGDGRGSQIRITPTQIFFQDGTKTSTTGSYTAVSHGLTITDFIKVMYKVSFGRVDYIVSTIGGYYKGYYEQPDLYNENYGRPFVWVDENTTLTDVILGGTSDDFRMPVWVIGDSYVSLFTKRWTYYPINDWKYKNWLLQGLAGGTSTQLFADLERSLSFGTPKYLVWCLGMNDHDSDISTPNSNWLSTIQSIITLCNEKNITLILATIPNTADIINEGKNSWIKESGYRYIDFAKAVNGEIYTSGVDNWYTGYNDDGTHPTILGAKALATQFITDFPEIIQYGE